MPTQRQEVRARRNDVLVRAKEAGIDLAEERRRYGTNQRALAQAAKKLLNEGAPRQDEGVLTVDFPPGGAFNGVNTTYQLTGSVAGHQVVVIWEDLASGAGPRMVLLRKSTDNPPAADEFYFDFNIPDQIIVGTPPVAGDALAVVYKSRLNTGA